MSTLPMSEAAATEPDLRTQRTWPFFVIALGLTWALQLPGVLAKADVISGGSDRWMPLLGLGAFGPTVAAVVLSRSQPGGVRGLFRRARVWRVGPVWYAVALLGFTAVYVASVVVYRLLGGHDAAWLYPPENAQHVSGMIVMPVVEEIGWRGYALPRLQRRWGAVKATAVLGVAWSAWHTMMFLFAGSSPTALAVAYVNIVVGCFAFTWLFNRTRGSLLLAVLAHVGVHLNNPTHAMPNVVPLAIFTAGLAVVGVASMLFDKRAWRAPYPL